MSKVELPPSVLDCLKNEMQIKMDYFFDKYNNFDDGFKVEANEIMSKLLKDTKTLTTFDSSYHVYQHTDSEKCQFIQSMSECFECLNKHTGIELKKIIFSHGSRGGNAWFPVVEILYPLADYSNQPEELVLYRGCFISEFNSEQYWQSWTFDFDTAKAFAFTHFSNINEQERVVIKARVKNTDIVWIRTGESEVVLSLSFKPLSIEVEMDYNKYCKSKNP
ncbi:hypothetical protein ES754_11320 [Psychrobacter frigidicola]|uniref:Uncharacterized protein n=1 Tax=Psychrobacter frigidicola TaxID=45611 RepID=A0A5C7A195_9GAMM|nr:hypothetical protein [Psychrobacter frigidicola]TXD96216.1 hypothetical protein ES754_11320 [Psychrobacter frigidicola]